jgi:hypothetical protein
MIINYDSEKNIFSIIHKNLYFIKKHPVNPLILDILILTITSLENLDHSQLSFDPELPANSHQHIN